MSAGFWYDRTRDSRYSRLWFAKSRGNHVRYAFNVHWIGNHPPFSDNGLVSWNTPIKERQSHEKKGVKDSVVKPSLYDKAIQVQRYSRLWFAKSWENHVRYTPSMYNESENHPPFSDNSLVSWNTAIKERQPHEKKLWMILLQNQPLQAALQSRRSYSFRFQRATAAAALFICLLPFFLQFRKKKSPARRKCVEWRLDRALNSISLIMPTSSKERLTRVNINLNHPKT